MDMSGALWLLEVSAAVSELSGDADQDVDVRYGG
jgi:hypothetical protein